MDGTFGKQWFHRSLDWETAVVQGQRVLEPEGKDRKDL